MMTMDQLVDQLMGDPRPITVIVGAGVSSGVPDADGMVELMCDELNGRGLGKRLARELEGVERYERYPVATSFIEHHVGQWLHEQLISQAVLCARKEGAPADFEGDGEPEHWHIPSGCLALARLVVERPERFTGVLTTNFDPLLSLAIEDAGGVPCRAMFSPNSDDVRNGRRAEGSFVLHMHGYWRGPQRGAPERAPLQHRVYGEHLRGHQVVVIGHRGRPGVLLDMLERLLGDPASLAELWWCAQGEPLLARAEIVAYDRLSASGAHIVAPVDAHRLLEKLADAHGLSAYPSRFRDEMTGIEFVRIRGGRSLDSSWLDDFYVAKTPVTARQYDFSEQQSDLLTSGELVGPGELAKVSWRDAEDFCRRAGMSLPSQAQYDLIYLRSPGDVELQQWEWCEERVIVDGHAEDEDEDEGEDDPSWEDEEVVALARYGLDVREVVELDDGDGIGFRPVLSIARVRGLLFRMFCWRR